MMLKEMFVVKVVFSGSILDVYFNRLKKMWWHGYGVYQKERNWKWFQGLGPEQSEDELIIWDGDYV